MQETIFVRDLAVVLLAAAASGWLLQRVGLSAVVGYLLAGMVIGPFSPGIQLVSNSDHIQLLAQMGLVFLMFAIGLGLSLARLQRMGLSIVVAVGISSILLFNLCRAFGAMMEWSGFQTMFLAGTLMISSSAIIIKVLDELNLIHQRAGQLALGITVLEDIVAVVLLTFFLSLIGAENQPSVSFWSTLGLLGAFVALLVVVSVLTVPRILNLFSKEANSELRVTAVAGLVLLAAVWAVETGYSLAMGAFVLGVVIAGTRFKDEVERSFGAIQNIFGAVFFVAVGMMFDFRTLAEVWWLVALVTILTLIVRPLSCAFGLIAVGNTLNNGLKAGLALIPIGEFAFVLIQVGKSSNLLPERFYALAIGVSLATAVIGPLLTRRAGGICAWVETHEPRVIREAVALYHRWLTQLQDRTNASQMWKLTSKRVFHTAFHLLFVSALLLAAAPSYALALQFIGRDLLIPNGLPFLFWAGFGTLMLAPLIAIWRNVEALCMILAEGLTRQSVGWKMTPAFLEQMLKTIAAIVLLGWLLLLVPFGPWVFWTLCLAAIIVLLYAPVLWRRLTRLHSRFELEFRERMKEAATPGSGSGMPISILERPQEWNLQIDEVTLPFSTNHAGRSIAELDVRRSFGCSILSVDRQGYLIPNPSASERLFAGDKLMILGTDEQLSKAVEFLAGVTGANPNASFGDIAMENVDVPEHGAELGQTLQSLRLVERFGVQVCAIQRGDKRILVPSSTECILAGDRLLLLGAHHKIREYYTRLRQRPSVA